MKTRTLSVSSIALSANGIATAQDQTTARAYVANITASFATGQVLAPNGSLAAGGIVVLPKSSKLTITSASDFSGTTFTINGRGDDGLPLQEVITGPNATTVTGGVPFRVIDSIVPSLGSTNDFTVGCYPSELELSFGAALGSPRPVTLASAANLSGLTFTINGRDRADRPISESIAGPNNNTVTSTKFFAAVDTITYAGGALSSTVTAGWGTTASSKPQPVDHVKNPFGIGLGAHITSGSPTYTVEHTFDDIYAATFNEGTAKWFPHATLVTKTVDGDGNYAFPVSAIRISITSGSGSVDLNLSQAGVG